MKKKIWLFITAIITVLVSIVFYYQSNTLDYELIINKLSKDIPFNLDLYYADINMLNIAAYNFNGKSFKKSSKVFTSYTEGFLPYSDYKNYVKAINNFRALQNLPPKNYFHDFYEDETRVIISFTGSLCDIYIIDKVSKIVSLIDFDPQDNLGQMYVSHIKFYKNKFIILAGQADHYTNFIYEISLDNYKVLSSVSIPTSSDAINDIDYSITNKGECVFLSGPKLKIYHTTDKHYSFIDLPFYATELKVVNNELIVLSTKGNKLSYVLLNKDLKIRYSSELSKPTPLFKLVDFGITSDYVYIITYDPNSTIYPNYITLYNFNGEVVYCVRITNNKDCALLQVILNPQ